MRCHLNRDVRAECIAGTVASEYSSKGHNEAIALIGVGYVLRQDTVYASDAGSVISRGMVPSNHSLFGCNSSFEIALSCNLFYDSSKR